MVIYIHLNDVERVFFAFVSQVLVFRTETVKASNKNYFSKINNFVVYKKKMLNISKEDNNLQSWRSLTS